MAVAAALREVPFVAVHQQQQAVRPHADALHAQAVPQRPPPHALVRVARRRALLALAVLVVVLPAAP